MGNSLSVNGGGSHFWTRASHNNSFTFTKFFGPPVVSAELDDGEEDDEFDDPVERMLKRTGCLEKHYSVQVGNELI